MLSFFKKIYSTILSIDSNSNPNFSSNIINTNIIANKPHYNKNFISNSFSNVIKLARGYDVINVAVRVSLKAKIPKIRITHQNAVELVLPKNINNNQLENAYKFVREKEEWIRSKLSYHKHTASQNGSSDFLNPYSDQSYTLNPKHAVDLDLASDLCPAPDQATGSNLELVVQGIPRVIPIFAQDHLIVLYHPNSSKHIIISENRLLISHAVKESNIARIIVFYLKQLVKDEISNYAWKISQLLQVQYNKISIRDTRSRWGSCSSSGNLSFSWRLIFAPRYVMEYVVVHELCHILEMNHSHRFWKLVRNVCPDYMHAKEWLKKHGRSLHSYFA